ncbi:hsp70 nucleotide exchange factor Fes1p [[Candida] railenensis]|uniref:Hsp70 nucleotide exchange factor FES1 n=1 Tax=[Candida] railenensis TaxID=45579 RepID=A0A9P0VVL1_9ASCO|nr:hsp70 nucleotide exchange factor Fes1p [[Candida] railenensis]
MEKLLQWSIAQQSGDKEAIEKIGAPDPEVLRQVFGGGPDEPTLMKQAIQVVENPEATVENKEIAFENFEMLIENLDNANNIENIKLWPSIINQLDAEIASSHDLRVLAASIIGIAVQNNPTSQEAFLNYPQGLQKLIEITSPGSEEPKDLYSKSLFAISSLIRNNVRAYEEFNKLNGWEIVKSVAETKDSKVKLRLLSLLSSIISTSDEKEGLSEERQANLHKYGIVDQLVTILNNDTHAGCIDKVLNIISTLYLYKFKFATEEIEKLTSGFKNIESLKPELSDEEYANAKKVIQ